ncbi:MarR family transcriptional regulator [Amphritea opalescens]|uniref:MarR family transcriptional regulator n=1 Tax=Amphritea opalescens TaxID=2490544 RepID=A0A430KLQ0_9GAMM|nr:MarR family winged helix-turn-helix transcriptional regulator [Amphritea opalescens]RTE64401.1 MarR family transcriptional regulator [Amphritea opalescens]
MKPETIRPADLPDAVHICTSELVFWGPRFATISANAKLAEMGLTRSHFRVMYFVRFRRGIRTNELQELLMINAASLNRVMRELVRDDYIEQITNEDDRRIRHHYVTAKGLSVLEIAFAEQKATLDKVFAEVGETAVRHFLEVLYHLIPPERRQYLTIKPEDLPI